MRLPTLVIFNLVLSLDYVAWKRGGVRSWFIDKLCDELPNHSPEPPEPKPRHILQTLTKVIRSVAIDCYARTEEREKQTPCVTQSLTRLLYFHDE